MSGPAPPNPGSPLKKNQPPKAPFLQRRVGVVAAGLALSATAYFYLSRPPTPRDNPALTISTPGIKNIEKAYSNGGATPTHTPAYGGTRQGDSRAVDLREGRGTGGPKHSISPFERPGVGDEQRPKSTTKVGEIWDQSMLGSHKGK